MDVVRDGHPLVILVRNYVVLVLLIFASPYFWWLWTIETQKIAWKRLRCRRRDHAWAIWPWHTKDQLKTAWFGAWKLRCWLPWLLLLQLLAFRKSIAKRRARLARVLDYSTAIRPMFLTFPTESQWTDIWMLHKVYARSSLLPRSDLTACRPMYRHRSKHYHNDILDRFLPCLSLSDVSMRRRGRHLCLLHALLPQALPWWLRLLGRAA